MVIFPKAKINIGLRISRKRDDGYHDLESIFYPVQLSDALEFVVIGDHGLTDTFTTTGLPVNCDSKNNLIMKVLHEVRGEYQIPFLSIHLHKKIPLGAGLGGGSSDAAFFLKALNRYFALDITAEKMKLIALRIGSDCPFFVDCIPSYAEGRGEILSPVDALQEALFLVLVNPGISISTREAYSDIKAYKDGISPAELYLTDISEWKGKVVNDFEQTIFIKHPEIARIKDRLYEMGAIYSSMSGSGSTVYGIFRNTPHIGPDLSPMLIYAGSL